MTTPGYRIKLHQSLITPMMLGGVPRKFAILNGTLCAAFVLGLHTLYILPISLIIHVVAVVMAKRDPYFFDVILRHIRQKKYYGT